MTTRQYCDRLQAIEESLHDQERKLAELILESLDKLPEEQQHCDQAQATTAIHRAAREVNRLRTRIQKSMKTTIVIIVQGGIITDVLSDPPLPESAIDIIDLDKKDDNRQFTYDLKRADYLRKNWFNLGV